MDDRQRALQLGVAQVGVEALRAGARSASPCRRASASEKLEIESSAPASSSASRRATNRRRSNSSWSTTSVAGADQQLAKLGRDARAVSPASARSTGTSRQPSGSWPAAIDRCSSDRCCAPSGRSGRRSEEARSRRRPLPGVGQLGRGDPELAGTRRAGSRGEAGSGRRRRRRWSGRRRPRRGARGRRARSAPARRRRGAARRRGARRRRRRRRRARTRGRRVRPRGVARADWLRGGGLLTAHQFTAVGAADAPQCSASIGAIKAAAWAAMRGQRAVIGANSDGRVVGSDLGRRRRGSTAKALRAQPVEVGGDHDPVAARRCAARGTCQCIE